MTPCPGILQTPVARRGHERSESNGMWFRPTDIRKYNRSSSLTGSVSPMFNVQPTRGLLEYAAPSILEMPTGRFAEVYPRCLSEQWWKGAKQELF